MDVDDEMPLLTTDSLRFLASSEQDVSDDCWSRLVAQYVHSGDLHLLPTDGQDRTFRTASA